MIDIAPRLILAAATLLAMRWVFIYARDVTARLQAPKFWMYVVMFGGIPLTLIPAKIGASAGSAGIGAAVTTVLMVWLIAAFFGMLAGNVEAAYRARSHAAGRTE
jgi:hypothetical protein